MEYAKGLLRSIRAEVKRGTKPAQIMKKLHCNPMAIKAAIGGPQAIEPSKSKLVGIIAEILREYPRARRCSIDLVEMKATVDVIETKEVAL